MYVPGGSPLTPSLKNGGIFRSETVHKEKRFQKNCGYIFTEIKTLPPSPLKNIPVAPLHKSCVSVCVCGCTSMFTVYRIAENVLRQKKHSLNIIQYFLPHFRIFQIRIQKCARMIDFLASISDAFSSITIFQSFNDWIRQSINKSLKVTLHLQSGMSDSQHYPLNLILIKDE